MNRPRFLADEDLRFEIVLAVRRLEPLEEIPRVQDMGLAGRLDPEILEFAASERLIVLSHDVNTLKAEAELRISAGRRMAGLMLAAQRRSTRSVAESIVLAWSASDAAEWTDRIVFLPF